MAKRAVATKKTLVDPLFSIPPGSEDEFVFSRQGTDDDITVISVDISEDEFNYGYDDEDDLGGDGDSNDLLDSPEIIGVVPPQVLRRAPGGQQVVDVVIEAEEIPGAINYEIQVVKV
jgi:hypothetical protein